jgi:hypothetical protein
MAGDTDGASIAIARMNQTQDSKRKSSPCCGKGSLLVFPNQTEFLVETAATQQRRIHPLARRDPSH